MKNSKFTNAHHKYIGMNKRKLRMGMIGGGSGAFIGSIHRIAAIMDGQAELVCGCFSSRPHISKETGKELYLQEDRIYNNYGEMFEKEAILPPELKMDFVAIVTPNHVHFEPAMMALEHGFHVVLDKPLTFSMKEAKILKSKVQETGLVFALTHTYSGYPAIKEARNLVHQGVLGKIRRVNVEYPQGWLSEKEEDKGNIQAAWRTDPKRAGKAGCMGDIGTHAFHLAEYVSGLKVLQLCAELNTVVPGRLLDDDGAALLRFNNGAKGILFATQVAAGEENSVRLCIYGEKGSLEWIQTDANTLRLKWPGRPDEIYRTGHPYMSPVAQYNMRTPGGHPEGYIEAFANIYRNFSLTVSAKASGQTPESAWLDFPSIDDGVRGMQFIETMIKSGYTDSTKWIDFID
jgi:predicted dehydrogenase